MKKSLIALAVLATTGAAFAQSSVTLYGRLDASVASVKTETTGVNPVASISQTGVNESNLNSTFWGLKGVEDLGGGLKAVFKLESRFLMDTGVGTAGLFDREANVGLDGGFGSVKLGRTPSPLDDVQGSVNAVFGSNFKTAQDVAKGTGVADFTGVISNSIKYISPSFSGFSVSAMYGFGENKKSATGLDVNNTATVNTVGSATDALSLNLKYAAGPLTVVYGHQEEKQGQAVLTTPQNTRKFDLIGGSYDFGVVKVLGDYAVAKDNARKDKAYQLGVVVPLGAFALAAGYTDEESTGAGVPKLNGKGFSLVGTYDLSKRTTLYAGYENTKTESFAATASATVNVGISEAKRSNFAAGVRHTF